MDTSNSALILLYVGFVWLVVIHTLEEISSGVMEIQLGHIKMTKNRYLLAAGGITTLNMLTLALLVLNIPAGIYLGLFTSAILGVLQAVVHFIGYMREGKRMRGLGAGFYSAIPLAIAGLIVFMQLLRLVLSR